MFPVPLLLRCQYQWSILESPWLFDNYSLIIITRSLSIKYQWHPYMCCGLAPGHTWLDQWGICTQCWANQLLPLFRVWDWISEIPVNEMLELGDADIWGSHCNLCGKRNRDWGKQHCRIKGKRTPEYQLLPRFLKAFSDFQILPFLPWDSRKYPWSLK